MENATPEEFHVQRTELDWGTVSRPCPSPVLAVVPPLPSWFHPSSGPTPDLLVLPLPVVHHWIHPSSAGSTLALVPPFPMQKSPFPRVPPLTSPTKHPADVAPLPSGPTRLGPPQTHRERTGR